MQNTFGVRFACLVTRFSPRKREFFRLSLTNPRMRRKYDRKECGVLKAKLRRQTKQIFLDNFFSVDSDHNFGSQNTRWLRNHEISWNVVAKRLML